MADRRAGRDALSLHAGVFLMSASCLTFELALTRIFSVILWYHFAYFVVSLSLFGLGAGGLVAYGARDSLSRRFPRVLRVLAVAQCASMVGCLALVLGVPATRDGLAFGGTFAAVLAGFFVACAAPFFVTGMCVSLVMRERAGDAPRIYFADLAGAGVACLLFVGIISLVSGPAVALAAALLGLASAVPYGAWAGTRSMAAWGLIVGIAAASLSVANTRTAWFRVKHTKTYRERKDVVFEKWSPLARITVSPRVWWQADPDDPFGWGMSPKFKPDRRVEQMWVEQDACAGTPITRFRGDPADHAYLRWDITAFAYHAHPGVKDVFIIGCGGGRDVLTALVFGVPAVRACDINPVTVGLVRRRYRAFSGDLFRQRGVDVEVAEGRSCLRRESGRFDLIQIPLTDSWAATAAGAFALAENNLYTVEAIREYLAKLRPGGMVSITRFLADPPHQCLRLAILARRAIELQGGAGASDRVAVVATSSGSGVATILIGASAFTPQDIERTRRAADDLGFRTLYLPAGAADPEFRAALTTPGLEEYLRRKECELAPPTDDWPFFFQTARFSRAFLPAFARHAPVGQIPGHLAPAVLTGLLALSVALVTAFFFGPLSLSRRVGRLPARWGCYFALLGLGFMFVEIFLLQRGALYLEHPTTSLSVVLCTMLVSAGLGSLWSRRVGDAGLLRFLRGGLLATVLLLGLVCAGLEAVIHSTMAWPLPLKAVVFGTAIAAVSLPMGIPFPSGIRWIGREAGHTVPWVWAINGGASVTGSIMAMALAMTLGYTRTLQAGCGCYALALLVVWLQARRNRAEGETPSGRMGAG